MTILPASLLKIELEKRLPHRFENFLLDSVDIENNEPEMSASLNLTILENDALGRQLFSRTAPAGNAKLLITPVYMEILALASIARIGATENHTFVFSSISDFECINPYVLGTTLGGHVKKVGSKGPFILVDGYLTHEDNSLIAKGSLMAALIPDASLAAKSQTSEKYQPEDQIQKDFHYKKAFKDPAMVMCDRLMQVDESEKTALTSYTYPKDHPCVRGHFPGAPIMMGIMQLMFVEDSCFAIKEHLNSASTRFSGNASVLKEDGSIIAQIKGFVVEFLEGDYPQPHLCELKKVSFKGIAEPGDTLFLKFDHLEM